MVKTSLFEESDLARELVDFHCPRYAELPTIDLYMDQLIYVIKDSLDIFYIPTEDKILTSAMINNYVKQGLVAPSKNKRYSKEHLAYLIVVCTFKKILSLPEICRLIEIQIESYPTEEAYDSFCEELENALKTVFTSETAEIIEIPTLETSGSRLLRSTVLAFVSKLYIQKYLEFQKTVVEKQRESIGVDTL